MKSYSLFPAEMTRNTSVEMQLVKVAWRFYAYLFCLFFGEGLGICGATRMIFFFLYVAGWNFPFGIFKLSMGGSSSNSHQNERNSLNLTCILFKSLCTCSSHTHPRCATRSNMMSHLIYIFRYLFKKYIVYPAAACSQSNGLKCLLDFSDYLKTCVIITRLHSKPLWSPSPLPSIIDRHNNIPITLDFISLCHSLLGYLFDWWIWWIHRSSSALAATLRFLGVVGVLLAFLGAVAGISNETPLFLMSYIRL